VTADLIFLAIVSGGSAREMDEFGRVADLLIFIEGSSSAMIRAPSDEIRGSGTTKALPNELLKRAPRSLISSTCWRWSSPTGTPWAW
jgi:hypothetical protein